jgi:hypothetical protein
MLEITKLLLINYSSHFKFYMKRNLQKLKNHQKMVFTFMDCIWTEPDGIEKLLRLPISSQVKCITKCLSYGSNLKKTISQIQMSIHVQSIRPQSEPVFCQLLVNQPISSLLLSSLPKNSLEFGLLKQLLCFVNLTIEKLYSYY